MTSYTLQTGQIVNEHLKVMQERVFSGCDESLTAEVESNLVIHYQPVVCYATGYVVGLEALLRYLDPKVGILYPDSFLNQLHKNVKPVRLFEWLLRETHKHSLYFNKCNLTIPISINLSADVFNDSSFLPVLKKFISNSVSYSLVLELTESHKIESKQYLMGVMHELRELNIKVSLDDFGAGFSNHDLIDLLPFDIVKIDKSLIFRLYQSREDAELLRSIIKVLKSRKIQIVAEGVNSIDEAEFLMDCGCCFIQGYGVNKGIPFKDIPLWINKSAIEMDWWTRKSFDSSNSMLF